MIKMNKKIYYTAAFSAFLISEVLIGLFAKGWLRNSFGDVLVMPAMYCFIRIFTRHLKKTLPLILFAFACVTELLQYLDLCGILGIRRGSLLSVIIGTHGDFKDIVCYAAGTVLIYILMNTERRFRHGRN